ncbi:gluconokinase [Paraburkholderia sp. UCT70]|uniref:gluconokinase n=1 Tax=Paraburkholderia sp. UCT70 TaxID=2991068 RepID=UPI003D1E06F6
MSGALVVMGVSGCGKSTLAKAIAVALGWHFIEGDDCHPASNIAKMRAGIPLCDSDRWPFLDSVAATLCQYVDVGAVASCSALRLSYRDRIRAECCQVRFVLPVVSPDSLKARMASREGHFMPASLLESQIASLELPTATEQAIYVDGTASTAEQVRQALSALGPNARAKGGTSSVPHRSAGSGAV